MYLPNCEITFSMGGAIAVHIAQQELLPSLIGLTVIDVVEGRYIGVPARECFEMLLSNYN